MKLHLRRRIALYSILGGLLLLVQPGVGLDSTYRASFKLDHKVLRFEVLTDNMVHFEYSAKGPGHSGEHIYTSPMVAKTNYPGPSQGLDRYGDTLETIHFRLSVNRENLCFTIIDKHKKTELTTLCPDRLDESWKGLSINPATTTDIYGLGQYFTNHGTADGNWVGRVWEPGPFGNAMKGFGKGAPSYAQYPVMYALGSQNENYALFLDQHYKHRFDFTRHWWRVDMWGDQIRGYVITGQSLPQLRSQFMDLVGKPLVAPKKTFGFWLSEFGYDNWGEVDWNLQAIRKYNFPIDGFVMDLQWYGGRFGDPDHSRMGTLQWDDRAFPNAKEKIAQFRYEEGIDLMLIEQSYVGINLGEHGMMADKGFFAKDWDGKPTFISHNPWWGRGGLIDWTNPAAGDLWHNQKRQPLVEMGINFHWTDLGEPEMYDPNSYYYGLPEIGKHQHADIHNLFNFKWLESIQRGYRNNNVRERFYAMSRSGAPGIQRFGAGMWSGDVGANMGSLAAHVNAHMHMSFSGVDYYGSDIGGFHRRSESYDGNPEELYTQWLAVGALLDIPVRPHCWNLPGNNLTNPSKIGHLPSNLANLRLRYSLAPYYYSLAHRAHRFGEPIMPPLVYYYQEDKNVRKVGNEVMIGRDLLFGIVASYGETDRNVYLPKGKWIDYHRHNWIESQGQDVYNYPVYQKGLLKLPLFARAGAIIPKMRVDEHTMNIFGRRSDGKIDQDLVVRVYPHETQSRFVLYEDDGVTIDYLDNHVRTTEIKQKKANNSVKVTIAASVGSYQNAPAQRGQLIELVVENKRAVRVTFNGEKLPICKLGDLQRSQSRCFLNKERNLIIAKTGMVDVTVQKVFDFTLESINPQSSVFFACYEGETVPGQSVYVVGSIPELGNWDPKKAVRLHTSTITEGRSESNFLYPTWIGQIANLPTSKSFSFKCIKRPEGDDFSLGQVVWEAKDHHYKTSWVSGYSGKVAGRF